MNKLAALTLALLLAMVATRTSSASVNQSLIRFTSHGKTVASNQIGTLGEAADFGGNEVRTPRHQIRLYVNFNIAGTIDLDQIDDALDRLVASDAQEWFKKKDIVVVTAATMERWHRTEDAFLNMAHLYYFVSATVLSRPGGFQRVIEDFFSLSSPGTR